METREKIEILKVLDTFEKNLSTVENKLNIRHKTSNYTIEINLDKHNE